MSVVLPSCMAADPAFVALDCKPAPAVEETVIVPSEFALVVIQVPP